MKPFLVDVAVKINVWIRPHCQKLQFDIIKKARPSILFLISDNGRDEREKQLVAESRKIVEDIDWDCTVYKLYEDENQGMYTMSRKMHNLVWSKVDSCILLEDDILPSVSYFQFCAELLEKYANDSRISCICGVNYLGIYDSVSSDYFFSKQHSIWGIAMWKRSYQLFYDFSYGTDPYIMSLLQQRTRHNQVFWKRILGYVQQEYYEGHVAGAEYFIEFAMYGHNQMQIIPKKNMIRNIGYGEDCAHSTYLNRMPSVARKIFDLPTHEVEFPLKHAKYVIPDMFYEKKENQIAAYNSKWRLLWRKIEMVFRGILHGDWGNVKKMISRKFKKIIGRFDYEREK